jgi:hypothetical protein
MKPILDWTKSKAEAYAPAQHPFSFRLLSWNFRDCSLGCRTWAVKQVWLAPHLRPLPFRAAGTPQSDQGRIAPARLRLSGFFIPKGLVMTQGWELHLPLSVSRGRLIENVRDAKKTIVIATA